MGVLGKHRFSCWFSLYIYRYYVMEDSLQDMRLDDVEESAEFPLTEGITDVSIQVQSTVMHVNKGILMVASPVFHKMLTSDFKEKEDGLIVLPEKNVDDVTLLLKSVYPNKHVTYTGTVWFKSFYMYSFLMFLKWILVYHRAYNVDDFIRASSSCKDIWGSDNYKRKITNAQ